ncbi:type VII secretion protein EccCa [Mycobacterium sp. DBP42]|nr:type VII secretion protein EccCa [Mycobacterium sp. DBP42]TMS50687.1 type VII secretion protein EccCa [Mycobacterium sp. DBP42]
MRKRWEQRRRIDVPDAIKKVFKFDPPPELPRAIERNWIQKALPYIIGVAVVGIVVLMFATGFRQLNPMYMVMMLVMATAAVGSVGAAGGGPAQMSTNEVDSERGEYLRYLSESRVTIGESAASQLANAEWSHPDPGELDAYVGSRRMWERGAADKDYLKIRIGRDEVRLISTVGVKSHESQLDLEPVAKTALEHLRQVQQSIPHCPKAVDLAQFGRIAVYGDRDLFEGAVRAWVSQYVTWHPPVNTVLAVASPRLEELWGWTKWLQHTESNKVDGIGPARYLSRSLRDLHAKLDTVLAGRESLLTVSGGREVVTGEATKSTNRKHLLVIVDDPGAEVSVMRKLEELDGVTVVSYRDGAGPGREHESHDRELLLRLDSTTSGAHMRAWRKFRWELTPEADGACEEPDLLTLPIAEHLARQISGHDGGMSTSQDVASAAAQTQLSLLNIDNAAALDIKTLWAPRRHEDYLRVPLGLAPDGAPVWIDFKDEAEGGMGPHGLCIGMTGAGKSTTLIGALLSLMLTHTPDDVVLLLSDFKGEAGFDTLADFPHVLSVISNLSGKTSLVDRFGDILRGLMDRREATFKEAGRRVQGSAFASLSEYNQARAEGHDLPPIPTIMVVVDEFSLMIDERAEIVEPLDTVGRKGRTLGMHLLLASQTLDIGKIKSIDKNIQYRIGMKVSSPSISRQIIGTEDAYNIEAGRNFKGTGYLVRAPGAQPVRFRGFNPPKRYEPPRIVVHRRIKRADKYQAVSRTVVNGAPVVVSGLSGELAVIEKNYPPSLWTLEKYDLRVRRFTAERVEPEDGDEIEETEVSETKIEGAPRSLALTVGAQLLSHWGEQSEQLWSPPLDEPISLGAVLSESAAGPDRSRFPWWPLGKIDQPRRLSHDLLTYSIEDGSVLILGGQQSGLSTALQTFVLSAASRYSSRDVGFYALAYGGPPLASLRQLPHVGAVAGADDIPLIQRTLRDLDALVVRRRRQFKELDINSDAEYRRLRAQADQRLDDGYPTDIFVIVDGWEEFLKDNKTPMDSKNPLRDNIIRLANAGHGVHVVITAQDSVGASDVQGATKTRWELKLPPMTYSSVRPSVEDGMRRPQDKIPAGQPGRGITASGDSQGDTIRFAVGTMDAEVSVEDLDLKVREVVAAIAAAHNGDPVPRPELLPAVVAPEAIGQERLGGEQIAIGLRDTGQPLVVDFDRHPLLAIYGDAKRGKKTTLRHLIEVLADRRETPEQINVMVFDYKEAMRDALPHLVEGKDFYTSDPAAMAIAILQLNAVLAQRRAPKGLTWSELESWKFQGAPIYLLIPDLDVVPDHVDVPTEDLVAVGAIPAEGAGGVPHPPVMQLPVLAPLIQHMAKAREIGLRVIMTNKAALSIGVEMKERTVAGQMGAQPSHRILMGSRNTQDKIGGRKFENLQPGRGYVLPPPDAPDNEGVVQLAVPHNHVLRPC